MDSRAEDFPKHSDPEYDQRCDRGEYGQGQNQKYGQKYDQQYDQKYDQSCCPVCSADSPAKLLFDKTLMGRYRVSYYGCDRCGFIQTEPPYWLPEAYADQGIAALDTGIVDRNLRLAQQTERLLQRLRPQAGRCLDFGGGSGLFVRLMRDRGFEFSRSDLYTDNLFARGFDRSDLPPQTRFDLITAFEVIEHLPQPLQTLETLWSQTDLLLFSTDLQPARAALEDWYYFYPESGQHISFFSRMTLEVVAQRLNAQLFSNNRNLHLLMRQSPTQDISALLSPPLWQRGLNRLRRDLRSRKPLIDRDMAQLRKQALKD